jgi:hypothetical protein
LGSARWSGCKLENWMRAQRAMQDQTGQDTLVSQDRAARLRQPALSANRRVQVCQRLTALLNSCFWCRTQLRHRDQAELPLSRSTQLVPPSHTSADVAAAPSRPPGTAVIHPQCQQRVTGNASSALCSPSLMRTSNRWLSWSSRLGATVGLWAGMAQTPRPARLLRLNSIGMMARCARF